MTDPAIVAMEAYKEGQVEHQGNGLPRGLEADKEKRMDDLINRQDAIEKFEPWLRVDGYSDGELNMLKAVLYELRFLPSAQPKQKNGKWIIRDNPGTGWYRVTCSECGEDVTSAVPVIGFFPNAKVLWDYCPWCGADMRGKGERDENQNN